MSQPVLTLKLPEEVFERVRRAATPSLDKVSLAYPSELEALEDRADDDLWKVAERRLTQAKQRRLANLLDKNQRGTRTDREHQALVALRTEADRLTLQRSYAYLLLKYRGHRIPNLADLP